MKTYRTIQLLAAGLGLYSGSASALQTDSVRLYDMGDREFTMAEYQAAQTSHFQTDKRPLANSIGVASNSDPRENEDTEIPQPDDKLEEYITITPQVLDLTQFPGEAVSMVDHTIRWNVNDVVIPGDGPDLAIGRQYMPFEPRDVNGATMFSNKELGFTWHLNIPHITIRKSSARTTWMLGCGAGFNAGAMYRVDIKDVGGFVEVVQDPATLRIPTMH